MPNTAATPAATLPANSADTVHTDESPETAVVNPTAGSDALKFGADAAAETMLAAFKVAYDADAATNDTDGTVIALPMELWMLGDVARFLRRSENTARKVIGCPDAPQAIYSDGAGSVWDPRSWWAWAHNRSTPTSDLAATTEANKKSNKKNKVGKAAGKSTRV